MLNNEIARLELTRYGKALGALEREYSLTVNPDGEPVLLVPVPGPEEKNACFSMDVTYGYRGDVLRMKGIYYSDTLPEGHMDFWYVSPSYTAEDVAEDLILPFVAECFDKEREKLLTPVVISDENLEDFLPFLDEEALENPEVSAIGFLLTEDAGPEPVAAASFVASPEGLIIRNIVVHPDYRSLGIGTYITHYLRKTYYSE